MVQELCKIVWQFLKRLNKESPHDPSILLMGIYSREIETLCLYEILYKNIHSSIIIIAKKRKQCKGPSTDEYVHEICYIHILEYYSAIERNKALIQATT